MSRGFQPDPIAEHAAVIELMDASGRWLLAEEHAKKVARHWLDQPGVRADTLAIALGMSRPTLYRWLRDRQVPNTHGGYAPPSP